MVPVVDGDGVVRVVRALGVDHIATVAAADVTRDVVTRIPQTEGFEEKLARPARDVEMLIGMDNQGWMPVHVESVGKYILRPQGSRYSPYKTEDLERTKLGPLQAQGERGRNNICMCVHWSVDRLTSLL